MPLSQQTTTAIHNYLLGELTRYIADGKAKEEPRITKPFHARLLPDLFDVPLSERSFSTRSGTWWQQIARLVALQFHSHAELGYRLHGRIKPAAAQHVDEIIRQLNTAGRRKPIRQVDNDEVSTVQSPDGDAASEVADLFIRTHDGEELYFEIKTATPNKDTSKAMKRFILRIGAMCKGTNASAFAATAYNPYGEGNAYKWNYALQFLEVGQDLLIGSAFWNKIGDDSTFDELLAIAHDVGHKLKPLVDQAIGEYKAMHQEL